MKVDLKGATFVITGTLSSMTRAQAEHAIARVGGKTSKSVSKKTSYVIVGERPSSKYIKAKNMGLPILTESDFDDLIHGREVQVEEVGEAGTRGVDELLGEVRSVMQGAPTQQMWHELVALVDACKAEDVHVLTQYIDGYIARWSQESMANQQGKSYSDDDAKDMRTTYRYWYGGQGITGELRVAPEGWVGEMIQGVDSPKYQLVRALDLRASKMTSTAVIKVLSHAQLAHIETLVLPENKAPSKTLVKLLCQGDETAGLEHLALIKIDQKTADAFEAYGEEPRALGMLDLSACSMSYEMSRSATKFDFLKQPYFRTVRTLGLSGGATVDQEILGALHGGGIMPDLCHLHFSSYAYNVIGNLVDVLNMPWVHGHVTEVSMDGIQYIPQHGKKQWQKLLGMKYSGALETLDLSSFDPDRFHGFSEKDVLALLDEMLPSATLLESIKTLVLGKWKAPETLEKLSKTHPHLTVL